MDHHSPGPVSLDLAYHELRGPLSYIANAAAMLALDAPDGVVRDQCERIERVAHRMLRTIRTLTVAAADAQRDRFDLVPSLRAALADATCLGLTIHAELPPGTLYVEASAEHLEALVTSLLLNAMDHGDHAHPVQVHAAIDGDMAVVTFVNRVAALPRHHGLGLGSVVLASLVRLVPGRLAGREFDGWYVSELALPLARAEQTAPSARDGAQGCGAYVP